MADSKKDKRPERLEDVETEPGAWERFERAVDRALHTPPKQRQKRERGEQDSGGGERDSAKSTKSKRRTVR